VVEEEMGIWESVCALGAIIGVLGVTSAQADTYTVNSTADAVDMTPGNGICATAGGTCTLRAAIQEANAHAGGDVVSLPSGLYLLTLIGPTEDLSATGDLDVSGALEVNGIGADTTIIDGLHSDRIFHTTNALTLRNVTLRRGTQSPGGGIYAVGPGATTIEGARFEKTSRRRWGDRARIADPLTIAG
jgi:CSLREA domain-containing protein